MEREQEREEFQQEIQRLEEQLRQAARPRPRGAPDGDVSWSHDLLHSRDSGSLWLLSFILKNVFAFHVPGNDSGRSGTSRYVWSLPSPQGYVHPCPCIWPLFSCSHLCGAGTVCFSCLRSL